MVNNCRQIVSAMTETMTGASSRIGLCPQVVKLNKMGKNHRVPVKIYNISAMEIDTTPKTTLCEHLQEMLNVGTIRSSKNPYSSTVVIVRNKNDTIRFCVDFRKLNTGQLMVPMPFTEQKKL